MSRYERDSTGRPVFAFRAPPGARAKRTRPNEQPEAKFQREVIVYLTYALPPEYRFTFSGAGVKVSAWLGNKLKEMGVKPGWLDLTIKHKPSGRAFWIELKSLVGRLTPEQAAFVNESPNVCAVCRTLPEIEAALIRFGITPLCSIERANRYA